MSIWLFIHGKIGFRMAFYELYCLPMPRKRRRKSARSKSTLESVGFELRPETKRTISGIVQIAGAILLYLVLQDEAGKLGTAFHSILRFFFGSWGMIFPFFLLGSGLLHTFGAGKLELAGLGLDSGGGGGHWLGC